MTGHPRYAIYYAAERGSALDRFGAQLLGYDAWTGEILPAPAITPDWDEVTADPRKYGFHGTLKAPFALKADKSEADLAAACAAFAEVPRVLPVIQPVVGAISGFIAVIPGKSCNELEQLAADCVIAFDSFRAPLTEAERARRRPDRLTARQRDHLDRWGYPYVMEEFRFHMTLTGRLDEVRREAILEILRARFAALGIGKIAIDRIALFRQGEPGARFRVVGTWPVAVRA